MNTASVATEEGSQRDCKAPTAPQIAKHHSIGSQPMDKHKAGKSSQRKGIVSQLSRTFLSIFS
jgi:hypothetical protein